MADWPTIASLATAGGTLVLAVATFASVRSANRAARTAERALSSGLRPLLLASRLHDPAQKVLWVDQYHARLPGGRGVLEEADGVIYAAAALRNAGHGIAVMHGWYPWPDFQTGDSGPRPLEEFRRLTIDLYIAPGDTGYWQGAVRDYEDPFRSRLHTVVSERRRCTIDLLYGDEEGGQRTITRFAFTPIEDGWLAAAARHWRIDGQDPR